jgi:hypothetical protein
MIQPSLQIGSGDWAVKETKLLGTNPVLNRKLPVEIDVTNATIGTRVNKQGIIENGPKNLFIYSEDLSNSIWSKNNSFVNQSVVLSPNKKLNVYKFIENTTFSTHEISQQVSNFLIDSVYTVSFFAKAGERTFVRLNSNSSAFGTQDFAIYDLSLGVVKGIGTSGTASIEHVGDGWYRCTRTLQAISSGAYSMFICLSTGVITRTEPYQGDGQSGIYLWGIQLEQSPVATEYYPTITRTNLARIDYSSGEAALLIEPQRTNLATYSEDYSNSSWNKASGSTIESSTITSPSGQDNAFLIDMTASGAFISKVVTFTAVPHSYSLFLKSPTVNGTYVINYFDGDHHRVLINLTTVWQRFELNFTPSAGNGFVYLGDPRSLSPTLKTAHVWGAQLEVGSYATSYIPTLASAVTRNADVIGKTGISDLIGQTEGTLFVESAALFNELNGRVISISDGTGSNRIILYYNSGSNVITVSMVSNGSVIIGGINYSITDETEFAKIAVVYSNVLGVSLWVNGLNRVSSLSNTLPVSMSRFGFDGSNGTSTYLSKVKSLKLFKKALTNTQLITLTTI